MVARLDQFKWRSGVSGNPDGRPPKYSDEDILLTWIALQNPFVSRRDVATQFGMPYDLAYRIQKCKYKRAVNLVRSTFNVEPVPVDPFTKWGSWAEDSQILGPSFTPQPCPARQELRKMMGYYEKNQAVPGLQKVAVQTMDDALVDHHLRNN